MWRSLRMGVVAVVLLNGVLPMGRGADSVSPWSGEWDAFTAADRQCPPPPGGLLLIGSSSIRLWSSADEDFSPWKVVNRGFGGAHMADLVRVVDRFVVPYKPGCIVVYAGDNDIAAGKDAECVCGDLMRFVVGVRSRGVSAPVIVVAIKPSPARRQFAEMQLKTNRDIRAIIAQKGGALNLHFADIWPPMMGSGNELRGELYVGDGLHLSPAGYRVWAGVIMPIVQRVATLPRSE